MTSAEPMVEELSSGVFRVPGFSRDQIRTAIILLGAVGTIHAEEAAEHRGELLRAMLVSGIDPVPREVVAQARRLARHRQRLLASGAFTTEALREMRQDKSAEATRTWISRRRKQGVVFTIEHDGLVMVPAFELRPDGTPRPGLAPAIRALNAAGLGGWELWTWFTARTPWLSGRSPEELVDNDPDSVAAAARSFVSNLEA
ncbi:MAG: hypothetical protein ABSE47_11290 [Acidimicrobiales bacterium]|jgi:hypothetical protein